MPLLYEFMLAGLIGVGLDYLFGDPRKMPHLVKWAGKLSLLAESLWVKVLGRTVLAGLFLWFFVIGAFLGGYLVLVSILDWVHPMLRLIPDSLIVFQSLAFRDLVKHVSAIQSALEEDGLEAGRKRVSWIVGRDTERMDENAVCRAAIESGAENLNDAVIAPGFWFMLLGPAGMLFFRICNTLDAMVGHRNERFEKVGKVSARMDDLLNIIPARLCSILTLSMHQWPRWWSLKKDASLHPSFNSGWTEAAMAHRLGVVIGGEMWEKGVKVQTEEMNAGARQPFPKDIGRCVDIMGEVYIKALGMCLLGFLILFVGVSYTAA